MKEEILEFENKAAILVDALPYIRDFNQKIVVIEYGCSQTISQEAEKSLMKDIVILKSIGMKPIVVHGKKAGTDMFRENKRIAKLIELCGVKAIGVCGVDYQTIRMTLDHNYIPVIVPNDIDTEYEDIDPQEVARNIGETLMVDKLIYLTGENGIYRSREEVFPFLTLKDIRKIRKQMELSEEMDKLVDFSIHAVTNGVNRAHLMNGLIPNALLLELFSVTGIGTVIVEDASRLYVHERSNGLL